MKSIFREYDIRGVVGQSLTADKVRLIGQAIGSLAAERGERQIAVARDARLSSPELCQALKQGLRQAGQTVIDLGILPTPVLYFATQTLSTRAGVMVTGSHNPPQYNGLKIVIDGVALHGDVIRDLYRRIGQGDLRRGQGGETTAAVGDAYIRRLAESIRLDRPLKVVVDCGNAVAGAMAPQLLRAIGAQVAELYCEVDGRFPHHHPDPSIPANLADLQARVLAEKADLGVAFDGDADRLGIVTEQGEIIWPDRIMMPLAQEVLENHPGAKIIYDVKCSTRLARLIARLGGEPIMWKTGHSVIKAKMRETGALLGGEMTGHFAFADAWYGFDDGLYAAARLLRILARDPRPVSAQIADYPVGINTPELRIPMAEGAAAAFMEQLAARADFGPGRLYTLDGLRVEFDHGWGLVRASNTTPSLVLRFEADDQTRLLAIQDLFRRQLLALDPALALPF
ncbi:MAG: phosphomannomutase/phosphoglucomutase [Pseudomonadota bacterium]|nr:phosphomannomutase/phosphoglucomutase [Pseudomonadota bacterium]